MVALTVNDLLDGHVVPDLQCLDRIYLNGYVPNLQVGGQVANFMRHHLGYVIPSPAIMERIGTAFRRSARAFAEEEHVPVVQFVKDARKIDVMRRYIAAQAATGRSGVAAIGVAQEFQNVFAASKRTVGDGVWFLLLQGRPARPCFYFYLWDEDFGPAFIKVCAYFPYPVKVWVNGHEWANVRPPAPGSSSPHCPAALPRAATRPRCRRFATGSARPGPDPGLRRPLARAATAAADRG